MNFFCTSHTGHKLIVRTKQLARPAAHRTMNMNIRCYCFVYVWSERWIKSTAKH